ncbi:hypothetical protein GH714_004897 [Hevea brasiliensis]|uniref:Uncharacterized protein n=1 Tax=Hevea brasiliensis TaxID=3981 RepID=A0A6A6LE27_HEVBR|nr:hypothetical protein GH714_004897 [Hevea brasiliensis]
MACETTKEAWDKIKEEFQGTEKTKQMKLLTLKIEYENLMMKETESIKDYTSRLMEVQKRSAKTIEDKSLNSDLAPKSESDDEYAVREAEKNKEVKLVYCSSKVQIADIVTKALPKARFHKLRSMLGVSIKNSKEEC